MKKIIFWLSLILLVLLFSISFSIFSSKKVNPVISFVEAKELAETWVNKIYEIPSMEHWQYADVVQVYDYNGDLKRYYFLFIKDVANISLTSIEQIPTFFPNLSQCYHDNFCTNNMATISIRAYTYPTGRSDAGWATRFYRGIPFFIYDKIEISKRVEAAYPGKKMGRPVFLNYREEIAYNLIDKNQPVNSEAIHKSSSIIVVDGWRNFTIRTISQRISGYSKIDEEMKGAAWA